MPKISELTDATTANDADEFVIVQSGVTKRVAKSELNLPPSLGFDTGTYYTTGITGTATFTATNNSCSFLPIYLPTSTTFDRIAAQTASSFSGTATLRLGIFNADTSTGKPSTVVLDAGTVSCTAASTVYAITISQTLTAGWYWLAAVTQGSATTNAFVRVSNVSSLINVALSPTALTGFYQGWAQTITGSFSTASVTALSGFCFLVALRKA